MKLHFFYFFLFSSFFLFPQKEGKSPQTLSQKNLKKKNELTNQVKINFLDLDYYTNQTFFKEGLEKKIKEYQRANDYYQMGILLLIEKKIKQAKSYFLKGKKKLVEKNDLYRFIYAIGYCQYLQKNYKEAEKNMLQTIKLEEYLKAFKVLALIYFEQEKYPLVKKNINKIKSYPDFQKEKFWQELEKKIENLSSSTNTFD